MHTENKPQMADKQLFGSGVEHRCAYPDCSRTGQASMMYNEPCDMRAAGVLELLPSLIRCREHAEQIARSRGTKPCQLQSGIFLLSETLLRLHDKLEAREFSSSAPYRPHEQDYLAWYLKNAHDRGEHTAEIDPLCAACTATESTCSLL